MSIFDEINDGDSTPGIAFGIDLDENDPEGSQAKFMQILFTAARKFGVEPKVWVRITATQRFNDVASLFDWLEQLLDESEVVPDGVADKIREERKRIMEMLRDEEMDA